MPPVEICLHYQQRTQEAVHPAPRQERFRFSAGDATSAIEEFRPWVEVIARILQDSQLPRSHIGPIALYHIPREYQDANELLSLLPREPGPQELHQFRQLPPELRQLIWQFAAWEPPHLLGWTTHRDSFASPSTGPRTCRAWPGLPRGVGNVTRAGRLPLPRPHEDPALGRDPGRRLPRRAGRPVCDPKPGRGLPALARDRRGPVPALARVGRGRGVRVCAGTNTSPSSLLSTKPRRSRSWSRCGQRFLRIHQTSGFQKAIPGHMGGIVCMHLSTPPAA